MEKRPRPREKRIRISNKTIEKAAKVEKRLCEEPGSKTGTLCYFCKAEDCEKRKEYIKNGILR